MLNRPVCSPGAGKPKHEGVMARKTLPRLAAPTKRPEKEEEMREGFVAFKAVVAPTKRPQEEEEMRETCYRRRATSMFAGVVGALVLFWPSSGVAQSHSAPMPLLASRVDPKEFGIQDDTITVISAVSFESLFWVPTFPNATISWALTDNFERYCQAGDCSSTYVEYWATLNLPAGAVIDFVGVNNATDTDAVMGVALWQRDRFGSKTMLVGYSFSAHGWDTDFAGPLSILVPDNLDKELLFQVEQAPSATQQYLGWVEVRWHRTVSPPPATASFNDVPLTDIGSQYIEALAASGITGGCGGGNYCPDANLTRRQMAIFLAKALGLHWPN